MITHSIKRAVAVTAVALILAANLVTAQEVKPTLKTTGPIPQARQYNRNTPPAEIGREAAFHRIHPVEGASVQTRKRRPRRGDSVRASGFGRVPGPAAAPTVLSFGTGGGDILEVEPNDGVAQAVSLPVNIFGEVSINRDVDFFAFEALAGEQITVEPFAARLSNSQLIADIALFDSAGQLLGAAVGDENNDPLIRYVSPQAQVLFVGITDADDLGGGSLDYLLNITRGNDVDEQEPNGSSAQMLPQVPATVFGDIDGRNDVDFYGFIGSAGQTLIVDLDAEVLGSRLDAEINLTDPQTGTEYFYSDQTDGDDPRFNIVLPYDGRYVIGIGSFNSNSSGFYRINVSIVSSEGAPVLNSMSRLAKKLFLVSGSGFRDGSVVEVNGFARKTTFIDEQTLRVKVKAKVGNVVTVTNPPDQRRSNPLLVQ